MKSEFKKCEAYFLKEAKAAALQLRSPPAEEATLQNEKRESEQTTIMIFSANFGKRVIDNCRLYFLSFLDKKKKQKKSGLRIKRVKFLLEAVKAHRRLLNVVLK